MDILVLVSAIVFQFALDGTSDEFLSLLLQIPEHPIPEVLRLVLQIPNCPIPGSSKHVFCHVRFHLLTHILRLEILYVPV
jgi:hypothetical protein